MRAVVTSKRPCRMGRGDIRRIPQDPTGITVGLLVGCPQCGKPGTVPIGAFTDTGQLWDESTTTLSLPAQCGVCSHVYTLRAGRFAAP